MPRRKTLSLVKLANKVSTTKKQIKFLQSKNLLPTSQKCPACNSTLTKLGNLYVISYNVVISGLLDYVGRKARFRCSCKQRGCISLRSGTIVENSKMSLRRFILLFYTFIHRFSYKQGSICSVTLFYNN